MAKRWGWFKRWVYVCHVQDLDYIYTLLLPVWSFFLTEKKKRETQGTYASIRVYKLYLIHPPFIVSVFFFFFLVYIYTFLSLQTEYLYILYSSSVSTHLAQVLCGRMWMCVVKNMSTTLIPQTHVQMKDEKYFDGTNLLIEVYLDNHCIYIHSRVDSYGYTSPQGSLYSTEDAYVYDSHGLSDNFPYFFFISYIWKNFIQIKSHRAFFFLCGLNMWCENSENTIISCFFVC